MRCVLCPPLPSLGRILRCSSFYSFPFCIHRSDGKDDSSKKPDIKLNVPEVLKVILVDDWEAVTKNNQANPSISTLQNDI